MPSLLLDKLSNFVISLTPQTNFTIRLNQIPVKETEARLHIRINATEDALCKIRQELQLEKSRSRKWERRAVVATADLQATKGSTDELDRLRNRLDAVEDEKTELEHRVTRLNRMLTVAEEQRGVAIARLAGFAGGIEGVQEENRILKGTVSALEDELDTVRECWQGEVEEMDMELREWESREVKHFERVKALEGKLDDVAIEKLLLEERLSVAQAQLLDREADRCLVSVLGAEKTRLQEKIEELTQTVDKVPGLENDNRLLKAEVREGKHRVEGISKILVTIKKKNDNLIVHAREKEQYGESMAQMFADMKKECERLRRERDEKARRCASMAETHEQTRLKQEEASQALQVELETKSMELVAYETNLKRLQNDFENKNGETKEYFDSYKRIAGLMKMNVASESDQKDLRALESTLSNVMKGMHDSEAEATSLRNELDILRKENESNEEDVRKLSDEVTQAKQVQTEMEERIGMIRDDNIRLHERGTSFEAEVNKLTKTNEVFERRMEELVIENDSLQTEVSRSNMISKTLKNECDSLHTEMKSMQASIASEREEMRAKLAERSASFTALENELKDARETHQTAASSFESHRLSLARRVAASEQRKEEAEQGLVRKERDVKELARICQKLKEENDGLKEAGHMRVLCDDSGDILALREMLAESENERDRLVEQVNDLQRVHGARLRLRRLSSSSVSSDEDMARRLQELEMTLEEEAREKEEQKQQLCEAQRNREVLKRQVTDLETTAKEKEMEADKLRGEMASIYSRMRKMACVSLPQGAEELLEEEEDLRRLTEIREAARREENERAEKRDCGRESRKLPAQKRKVRMGVIDSKTRFRV